MPTLIPIEGDPSEPVSWETGACTIGREAGNHVVLRHPLASRRHCQVEVRADGAWLVDLKSRHGVRKNGATVSDACPLHPGDVIEVADWKACFHDQAPGSESTFVVVRGEPARTVAGAVATIGRRAGATVVVRHPSISRLHATITRRGEAFVLRDAGSTNGTYVGGERIVERTLASGDQVGVGREEGAEDFLESIRVSIRGATCTLEISAEIPGSSDAPTGDYPLSAQTPDSASTAAFPRRAFAAQDRPERTVIAAPVRGKAKRRAERWVPTSDIRPAQARRTLVAAATLLAVAAGGGALLDGRAEVLTTGGMLPGHTSAAFREQTSGKRPCEACHTPFAGVSDGACKACHERGTAPPHDRLDLTCAGCHREHAPEHRDEAIVGRHRCLDCHPAAHRAPAGAGGRSDTPFLGHIFAAPLVHADHRDRACRECHAEAADGSAGAVTTGCAGCHGGASGLADARCFTCHRFHEPAVASDLPASD